MDGKYEKPSFNHVLNSVSAELKRKYPAEMKFRTRRYNHIFLEK